MVAGWRLDPETKESACGNAPSVASLRARCCKVMRMMSTRSGFLKTAGVCGSSTSQLTTQCASGMRIPDGSSHSGGTRTGQLPLPSDPTGSQAPETTRRSASGTIRLNPCAPSTQKPSHGDSLRTRTGAGSVRHPCLKRGGQHGVSGQFRDGRLEVLRIFRGAVNVYEQPKSGDTNGGI